jgi:hypothetical protein
MKSVVGGTLIPPHRKYGTHKMNSPQPALWGPPSCTVLQGIGSLSYGKGALHQIWVVEPESGKKILKKAYRTLKMNVLRFPHSASTMSCNGS